MSRRVADKKTMSLLMPPILERSPVSARPEVFLLQDPVMDDTVAGLGEVALVATRVTGKGSFDMPHRVHRLFTVELDDYKHAVEITDPVEGEPDYAIFSYPGFTQHICDGIRQQMHAHTSYAHPQARVVSVESDGIGSIGDRFDWADRHSHGIIGMAEKRQRLARILAEQLPVLLHGTSMGTAIGVRMIERNLVQLPGHEVDIRGQVLLTPAIVTPDRTKVDMAMKFPATLSWSMAKHFARKPASLLEMGRLASHNDLGHEDLKTMGWQITELLRGTPLERTQRVIDHVPTVVIFGEDDSLKQTAMYETLAANCPEDHLKVIRIHGMGHELGAIPRRACLKMQKESQHLIQGITQDVDQHAS